MKPAGCVVLYHPKREVLENIRSYLPALGALYVIDNSERQNREVIDQLRREPKCHYYSMRGNQGIAAALNRGIGFGYYAGYRWVLTMDQDSSFPAENVGLLTAYTEQCAKDKVAIVCGRYEERIKRLAHKEGAVVRCNEVITSGSMVRTDVWKRLGGYKEELFIDEVDDEYCMRARLNGYQIMRVEDAVFVHQLGNAVKRHGYITRNYPPFRYYYVIRNLLYVIHTYQKAWKRDWVQQSGERIGSQY